jgi:hypothetical protein
MSKLGNIINGWGNLILDKTVGVKDRIKAQAELRTEICNECDLNKSNVCSSSAETQHVVYGTQVYGCGCPLSAKTMSEHDSCPAGKWHQMLNEEQWNDVVNLSRYKTIAYYDRPNVKIRLYNNGKFFTNDNLEIVIPYLGMYRIVDKLYTTTLLHGKDVLNYNFNAKILSPIDSFISYVNRNTHLFTGTYHQLVIWIPMSICSELSPANYYRACQFAMQEIINKVNADISLAYVVTQKDNIEELHTELDKLGVYKEKSNILPSINTTL